MQDQLSEYIANHISPEPDLLAETYLHTQIHHLYPRMCSGHIQGRILKMLTAMIRPKKVLELGTFTGYSALCIAEGMPEDAHLHTVEIDDEMEDELLTRFARSAAADRIHLHIGDALEVVPTLENEAPFDMVFIDANKRHYPEYFEMTVKMVRPGGFIIVANTLWDGKVAEAEPATDPQTRGIMKFNDIVARDPRVETAMIPLRDGLTILRVLP